MNNLFLERDFQPKFTLVDIETSADQYHFWSEAGSGYAELDAARDLLIANGADGARITTVNPRKTAWDQAEARFDLVTSLYSCGFHYPIDEYFEVFTNTLKTGGAVCLDLRRKYLSSASDALRELAGLAEATEVYRDGKSSRFLYTGKA